MLLRRVSVRPQGHSSLPWRQLRCPQSPRDLVTTIPGQRQSWSSHSSSSPSVGYRGASPGPQPRSFIGLPGRRSLPSSRWLQDFQRVQRVQNEVTRLKGRRPSEGHGAHGNFSETPTLSSVGCTLPAHGTSSRRLTQRATVCHCPWHNLHIEYKDRGTPTMGESPQMPAPALVHRAKAEAPIVSATPALDTAGSHGPTRGPSPVTTWLLTNRNRKNA